MHIRQPEKINFNDKKKQFIESIHGKFEWDPRMQNAFSLGVNFIALNFAADRDLPIVVCAYGDDVKQELTSLLVKFLTFVHPEIDKNDERLSVNLLLLNNADTVACLKSYCRRIEDFGVKLFYTADHISWFKALPEGMMYVINFNGGEVTGGLNAFGGIDEVRKPLRNNDEYALLTAMRGPVKMLNEPERVHDLFYQEADAHIVRAIHAPEGELFSDIITIDSPDWEKEACVALRRYQSRECRDGFRWDATDAGWQNVLVHPVVCSDVLDPEQGKFRQAIVGYVTFTQNENGTFTLANAWLHPFYRRKGVLTKMWPNLIRRYGCFDVDLPNADMREFLKKIGSQKHG